MYYSVPGGFAILVRPETIGTDLYPLAPRFLDDLEPADKPWLVKMIERVTTAYSVPSNSRQIAVIVTDAAIDASADLPVISSGQLERAFSGGAEVLPAHIRNAAKPRGCKATAMVYHFANSSGQIAQRFVDAAREGQIARRHLDRARLTALV